MQNEFMQDYLVRDKLNREIAELHKAKTYRPTVSIILRNSAGQFLFVQSAKKPYAWSFVQGGVNLGEGVISAVLRELKEEVGIYGKEIGIIWYCGSNQVDIPDWEHRDGFTNGKRYYHFLTNCLPMSIRPSSDEIKAHSWINREDAKSLLGSIGEEKRQIILSALDFEFAKTA